MRLLLSEILPLRSTKDLGDYAVDRVLPWRFGDLRENWFELIRLEDDVWFVADHVMTVTGVRVGKESATGWQRELRSNDVGKTWTVLRMAAPVPEGEAVSAVGTGYLNPVSGALVENPADVVEVIEGMAGRTGDWSQLRAECSRDGITVAGSLNKLETVQTWIHDITSSVGAIWSLDVKRLYPVETPDELEWPLASYQVHQLTVTADAQETADVLRVGYDWSDADQRAQHSITLKASPVRFDGKIMDLELRWLRKARAAELVGSRLIKRLASRRYQVTFTADETRIRPGHWVQLIACPMWPFSEGDPHVMVTSVTVSPNSKAIDIVGEVVYSAPTAEVTDFSLGLESTTEGLVEVAFKNGVATFTVLDDNSDPLVGARCALDSGMVKETNNQGKVSFTTARGSHTLIIEHPEFNSQTLLVKL
jgi:hypothetical protein